jgi:hypothetical protein
MANFLRSLLLDQLSDLSRLVLVSVLICISLFLILLRVRRPFFEIAKYLSERSIVVLQYNKRGIDASYKILDSNVWGNATVHDLQQDAEKVLDVLIQQPEVDASCSSSSRNWG